ncbi:MAG: response regulator transcription factor [Gammaproteobacteria bacterium]|nr:response regulator transcription factor [Gammaproteobacteria bacterium]
MKILLIDDHALFREGLLLVLEGLNTFLEAYEAGSYESAKNIIDEHSDLDLILLDLGLPGISYLDALSAIQQQLPDTIIVVFSGTEDHRMVEQALRLGARGYIPKSSPSKIMLNALQLVISGGTYVPPEILQGNVVDINIASVEDNLENKLTPRQCDVLHQLADGKSNKEIGVALDLTESTVRAHVAAILKAFNVSNRTRAVQYAMQKSWLKLNVSN